MLRQFSYNPYHQVETLMRLWLQGGGQRKTLLEEISVPVIISDLTGRFLDGNLQSRRLCKDYAESFTELSFTRVFVPEKGGTACTEPGDANRLYKIYNRQGPARSFFVITFEAEGYLLYFLVEVAAESLDAEETLLWSEQRYTMLMEQISQGIFICNQHRFLLTNAAFCQAFSLTRDEVMNITPQSLIVPEQQAMVMHRLLRAFRQDRLFKDELLIWCRTQDARIKACILSVGCIVYQGCYALQGVVRDMTEQEANARGGTRSHTGSWLRSWCVDHGQSRPGAVRERSVLLSKFSMVGEMSASIAHEVRNPMTTVRGLAQLLSIEHPEKSGLYELMIEEIDRANQTLSQFLSLAQNTNPVPAEVEISVVLQRAIDMMYGVSLKQGVRVFTEPHPGIRVFGDEEKLTQVFMNILENALEASRQGDTVEVVTEIVDHCVWVKFTDQGCGIEDCIAPHIMEPFFTTKDSSPGLGLSVAYKIIQDHNGDLHIDSRVNEGTTVSVSLPLLPIHSCHN